MLGETVRADIRNAPTPAVGVTLGLDNQTSGGQPLPLDLSILGMTGCLLHHSGELLGLTTATDGNVERLALPLPNQPILLGVSIYVQAYAFAPGANPLQVITSNGLEWVLGDV